MCHPGRVRQTVRSVLASPSLASGDPELLTGHDRLDAPVRWVHVSEVREVSGLLQGGELILTTGIAMGGAAAEAVGYLRDLVAAGASGLVVELGTALPAVPEAVLAEARAAGFPVAVLHGRVRFVEVTEEVHRGMVAEQYAEVQFAREVHETFTRLSLENADASTIVSTTATLCGSSVVLEDLARHVLAFEAVGRPAAGLLADWESRSRTTPLLEATGLTGPEGWLTAPVGRRGDRWGRLVVPTTRTAQDRLAMVLERAAQALELGRMVERDRLGLELQAQGGLLADLAEGRIEDEETAAARARSLGLAAAPQYVAVVARGVGGPGLDPVAEHDRSRDLVERLSSAVRSSGLSGLVGAMAGSGRVGQAGVLLGVPAARGGAGDPAEVLDRLAAACAPGAVVLGAGAAAHTLLDAGAGLRLAAHVAEVASAMPGERLPWYRSADVRLYGLMALLHDDPRVQAFVESELSALLEHEARHHDGMLELLRQYVAAGGNKTRLAEAAHRSRPAVYKKLARLERILGVDLSDPTSLMSLGVALMAHDLGHAPL